jgi:pre-mRNA cleavage complex 2 protein Pcf11
MQRQQLTQEQLKLVRDQVSALAPKPALPTQSAPHIPATSAPTIATPPGAQSFSQPLQQLLNPGTLAELIKATAARQQPTPPPQIPVLPQIPVSSTPQIPTSAPENPLIAALRAKGLLPASSAPPGASIPQPNVGPFPFIVPGQVRYTPPVPTPQTVNTTNVQINVQMNTASIKM